MTTRLLAIIFTCAALASCTTISRSVADGPIEADLEGRTMGEVIDDKSMRTRLTVNLEKLDPRFEDAHLNVHVNAGIVLLIGQVPSADMIQKATQLLRSDKQVKAIHNHLTAEPNTTTGLRTNDNWLALKTKSRMFTTDNFPSSKVDIIVEKGIVYLMGRVTESTAKQAVTIATEVNGVQKVVMVFQLIP